MTISSRTPYRICRATALLVVITTAITGCGKAGSASKDEELELERGRRSITGGAMSHMDLAAKMYRLHTGAYPSALASLLKSDGSPNWQGPYLEQKDIIDGWGTPLTYERKDGVFRIVSAGADRKLDTSDDIE